RGRDLWTGLPEGGQRAAVERTDHHAVNGARGAQCFAEPQCGVIRVLLQLDVDGGRREGGEDLGKGGQGDAGSAVGEARVLSFRAWTRGCPVVTGVQTP